MATYNLLGILLKIKELFCNDDDCVTLRLKTAEKYQNTIKQKQNVSQSPVYYYHQLFYYY